VLHLLHVLPPHRVGDLGGVGVRDAAGVHEVDDGAVVAVGEQRGFHALAPVVTLVIAQGDDVLLLVIERVEGALEIRGDLDGGGGGPGRKQVVGEHAQFCLGGVHPFGFDLGAVLLDDGAHLDSVVAVDGVGGEHAPALALHRDHVVVQERAGHHLPQAGRGGDPHERGEDVPCGEEHQEQHHDAFEGGEPAVLRRFLRRVCGRAGRYLLFGRGHYCLPDRDGACGPSCRIVTQARPGPEGVPRVRTSPAWLLRTYVPVISVAVRDGGG